MSAFGFVVTLVGAVFLYEAITLMRGSSGTASTAGLTGGTNATTARTTGGGSLGPSATPAGDVASWIDAAIAQTGVDAALWRARLASLIQTESGGSPTALNPLHVFTNGVAPSSDPNVIAANSAFDAGQASGILQTLPTTFRQYNPSGNIWNPIDNIVAAIRYIQHRYVHGGINDPQLVASEAAGIGY